MFKKAAFAGIGLALLVAPSFTLAQSVDVQAQIASLLSQIKQLQALLAQIQGQGSVQSNCVDLYQPQLTLGSQDSHGSSDVSNLQGYLIAKGYLDAQYNTGYYGFITAQAVGKIQMNLGVLTSTNDSAYGIVGPKTRAALACHGTPYVPPTPPSPQPTCSLSAKPYMPAVGESTTLFWTTSSDATYTTWQQDGAANVLGLGSDKMAANGQQTVWIQGGKGAQTPTLLVFGNGKGLGSCSTTIQIDSANLAASASLDVSNMSFSTGEKSATSPLITGSASNVSQVSVDIKGNGAKTNVVNGRWQAYLNSVYPGTYDVQISDNDSGPNFGMVLARGTLTVTSPSAPSPVITYTSAKAAGNLEGDLGGELDINGSNLATVNSTQVYIGGISAAVTWTSASQVNVIVPSSLAVGQYYDLYIVNRNGTSNTLRLHVIGTVAQQSTNPVVIYSFNASKSYVTPGQPITFSWSSNLTNSDIQVYGGGCSINGINTNNQQVYVANGASGSTSLNYNPGVTATYTLTCASGGKDGSPSSSRQVTVTVSYAAALPQCPANPATQRSNIGQTFQCSCAPGFALQSLWGSNAGFFTDSSDICTAGVQAGQINNTYGGEVDYVIEPGKPAGSYTGATINGVTSQTYGDYWPGSFQINGPKG